MAHSIAIHESKSSDKVVKFVNAQQPQGLFDQLLEFTNARYARRIITAQENGSLYGVYLTKSGNLRATFI
jgi:hypothetical protein